MAPSISRAFVTGATGLLGSNLVRLLASRGVEVRALARSRAKAERQLGDLASASASRVRIVELTFRLVEETLDDEIAWFRANGMLPRRGGEAATTRAREGSFSRRVRTSWDGRDRAAS